MGEENKDGRVRSTTARKSMGPVFGVEIGSREAAGEIGSRRHKLQAYRDGYVLPEWGQGRRIAPFVGLSVEGLDDPGVFAALRLFREFYQRRQSCVDRPTYYEWKRQKAIKMVCGLRQSIIAECNGISIGTVVADRRGVFDAMDDRYRTTTESIDIDGQAPEVYSESLPFGQRLLWAYPGADGMWRGPLGVIA